jgi:hypothetical protein
VAGAGAGLTNVVAAPALGWVWVSRPPRTPPYNLRGRGGNQSHFPSPLTHYHPRLGCVQLPHHLVVVQRLLAYAHVDLYLALALALAEPSRRRGLDQPLQVFGDAVEPDLPGSGPRSGVVADYYVERFLRPLGRGQDAARGSKNLVRSTKVRSCRRFSIAVRLSPAAYEHSSMRRSISARMP